MYLYMYVYEEKKKSEYTWEGGSLESSCGIWRKKVRAVCSVVRTLLLYKTINVKKFNFYDQERGRTNEVLRWGQVLSHVEDKRKKLGTLRLRMDEEGTSQFWLGFALRLHIISTFFF